MFSSLVCLLTNLVVFWVKQTQLKHKEVSHSVNVQFLLHWLLTVHLKGEVKIAEIEIFPSYHSDINEETTKQGTLTMLWFIMYK